MNLPITWQNRYCTSCYDIQKWSKIREISKYYFLLHRSNKFEREDSNVPRYCLRRSVLLCIYKLFLVYCYSPSWFSRQIPIDRQLPDSGWLELILDNGRVTRGQLSTLLLMHPSIQPLLETVLSTRACNQRLLQLVLAIRFNIWCFNVQRSVICCSEVHLFVVNSFINWFWRFGCLLLTVSLIGFKGLVIFFF